MASANASTPWINCNDAPMNYDGGVNGVSCSCVRFDRSYESLWTVDTTGLLTCFTISDKVPSDCAGLTPYSRFRPVKGPIGLGFAGNANRPLTTVMSTSSLHVHKAGGVSVFSTVIEPYLQRKVQNFISLENKTIFTGETPVVGVARTDGVKDNNFYSLDPAIASAPSGGNLQLCLPKVMDETVQKWLPIGIANGSVALCDHENGFKTIGTTGRVFQTRVNAVRCIDNTIVAVHSLGNTTTVKIFDARKITDCVNTINSIDGTIVDLDLYRNGHTGNLDMLMVTPQMFYVFGGADMSLLYRSVQIESKKSIISCSVSGNSNGSVVSLTSGHLLMMRRVNSVASVANFSNLKDEGGLFPPQPLVKSNWHISKTDIAAGFNHNKDPETLLSAWPPSNYMILCVEEKHKAPTAHMRQVMEMAVPPGDTPEFTQLVPGRRVYAFRSDGASAMLMPQNMYRPDPKDKISRFIPNPYPFNCEVGTDPTQVASIAAPKLKELKAKRTGRDSKYFLFSEAEEALQVCYPLVGTFDWKAYNNFPKDIVGIDNTLPESWIAPIIHCLYLVHGPTFPIRTAIIRHFCPRPLCVACELNIVFTNMMTASTAEGCQPIVQLGALIAVLKRRKEFTASKVFSPARNRDEMVQKLHLAQRLMLLCLDKDFAELTQCATCAPPQLPAIGNGTAPSSQVSSPTSPAPPSTVAGPTSPTSAAASLPLKPYRYNFPELPEPPEMGRIIKEYFGTQLDAQSPIDPVLFWELPPSAAKVEEGLTHVLKQVEFSRPQERIHIRALPPVLVILLNPDHGHLQPPPTLTFTRDKETYSYSLCCQVHHLSDDIEDKGFFISTHTWPKAAARPDIAGSAPMTGNDYVMINDYYVTKPLTAKQFEASIPPSTSHSVALGYYSYDAFTPRSFNYARGPAGTPGCAPAQLSYKDTRRHLLNTWNFLGPLLVHDTISDALPQPRAMKYPPQRFIKSLDDVQSSDLIAIDAEYVIPQWGNQVEGFMRKPYYLLARVSCIASSASGDERLLLDDYIATDEEIKDYVSQYSGIHRGDLEPEESAHPLTTRKANYMKLRALIDRGCRFVGHGLSQDFRVCNVQVPAAQTIDTVELFAKTQAAGGRKFALRHLASALLNETIQEDEHDSVEDARTALRLYRRYCELQASGQLEAFVDTFVCGGSVSPAAVTPSTLTSAAVAAAALSCNNNNNSSNSPANTAFAPAVAASTATATPATVSGGASPAVSATPAEGASALTTPATLLLAAGGDRDGSFPHTTAGGGGSGIPKAATASCSSAATTPSSSVAVSVSKAPSAFAGATVIKTSTPPALVTTIGSSNNGAVSSGFPSKPVVRSAFADLKATDGPKTLSPSSFPPPRPTAPAPSSASGVDATAAPAAPSEHASAPPLGVPSAFPSFPKAPAAATASDADDGAAPPSGSSMSPALICAPSADASELMPREKTASPTPAAADVDDEAVEEGGRQTAEAGGHDDAASAAAVVAGEPIPSEAAVVEPSCGATVCAEADAEEEAAAATTPAAPVAAAAEPAASAVVVIEEKVVVPAREDAPQLPESEGGEGSAAEAISKFPSAPSMDTSGL